MFNVSTMSAVCHVMSTLSDVFAVSVVVLVSQPVSNSVEKSSKNITGTVIFLKVGFNLIVPNQHCHHESIVSAFCEMPY